MRREVGGHLHVRSRGKYVGRRGFVGAGVALAAEAHLFGGGEEFGLGRGASSSSSSSQCSGQILSPAQSAFLLVGMVSPKPASRT